MSVYAPLFPMIIDMTAYLVGVDDSDSVQH